MRTENFMGGGTLGVNGFPLRPDIQITGHSNRKGYFKDYFTLNALNVAGYIPGVSTLSGVARILIAIVHTIKHLWQMIFDKKNCDYHKAEAKLGSQNLLRGCIEILPILGNIALGIMDYNRGFKLWHAYYHKHISQLTEQDCPYGKERTVGYDIFQRMVKGDSCRDSACNLWSCYCISCIPS